MKEAFPNAQCVVLRTTVVETKRKVVTKDLRIIFDDANLEVIVSGKLCEDFSVEHSLEGLHAQELVTLERYRIIQQPSC